MAALATGGLTRSERPTTSFQRKGPDGGGARLAVLPGTRPSVRHGQLLLSSGVPSLDYVLGGGLAVGTLLLIEEDVYGIYSNLLFKHFLSEGIVCGHNLFVASDKEEPADILKELPSPLLNYSVSEMEEVTAMKSNQDSQESMKIAWRYQNVPKVEVTQTAFSKFGHYFDLSKTMAPELIQNIKWYGFPLEEKALYPDIKSCNMAYGYTRLLHSIQKVIHQQGYDGSIPQKKQRNVLRIGIQSIGSVLWGDDICSAENPENIHSLTKFLYALRGLLRTSLSVCIITIPAHLIQNKGITERVTNVSDTVVGLESFIGSERETNPLYKDYLGLIHIHQIPRLNSLSCDVSDTKDLAFRLKRKLFVIERLHLPPDLSDTASRASKQDVAESAKLLSSGCSAMAIGKKHLDF
ncbi:elongator complex protein 4 isoform X1 [Rhineura floridana]|uniref:elongator complex protein 4 isoform X1 n=1 Tax=Rhineura floridana TaxID=261503 RepID=UPI002AC81E90|nr:elongator complex protein 4 isoform X1 [Rhineura floridana]